LDVVRDKVGRGSGGGRHGRHRRDVYLYECWISDFIEAADEVGEGGAMRPARATDDSQLHLAGERINTGISTEEPVKFK
jgi:hypothetical protein